VNEQDIKSLKLAIHRAFASVGYPGDDNIVGSICCEEEERVIADFRGKKWKDVPEEVVDYHYDSLPLFSPEAYCYYLPRYFCTGLDMLAGGGDLNVLAFTMYSLYPDPIPGDEEVRAIFVRQASLLTPEQRGVICLFLEAMRSMHINEVDVPDIDRALKYWRSL